MSYETGQTDLPPVTDWVNDWDWLDGQWGTEWANGQERGPRVLPVVLNG